SGDNPKADWYVWADAKPDGTAPNNWLSLFGGPAWEWDATRRQYYLHNFLASQPDLNFHNPQVQDALLETVRFWLDRGVNYYVHDRWLRSNPPLAESVAGINTATSTYLYQEHLFDKSQPENLAFLRRFRALLDEYEGRAAVGEIGDETRSLQTLAAYTGGGDKLQMSYTFD
ncbi:MAG: alpha-glucosidase, partial [Mesorhizobium sp.]